MNQVNDKFDVKKERTKLYMEEVKKARVALKKIDIKQKPREGNACVDFLATVASMVSSELKRVILES